MAGDWIATLLSEDKVSDVTETATGEAVQAMADSTGKGATEEEPELLKAIKKIGERITNLFTTTIPGFIQNAWKAVSELGDEIFKGISWIFNGEIPEEEKDSTTGKIAEAIRKFLVEDLPAKIAQIWSSIKTFGVDLYDGISAAFSGKIAPSERAPSVSSPIGRASCRERV